MSTMTKYERSPFKEKMLKYSYSQMIVPLSTVDIFNVYVDNAIYYSMHKILNTCRNISTKNKFYHYCIKSRYIKNMHSK